MSSSKYTHWKKKEDQEELPCCVTMENIYAAAKRIEGGIIRSSCRRSRNLSSLLGCNIYIKSDFQQNTGSFKERGALNSILQLSASKRRKGIIAASAGNHALALAYHGGRLNVPVTVVMPTYAPQTKIQNCRSLGATVIIYGSSFSEATEYARRLGESSELTYIHGFNDPAVIAGQGSIGLEILEQQPDVDAIIVPIGGGGLIAGIALAVKQINPNIDVIGVEPASYPSVIAALTEGEPIEIENSTSTIADGLAVKLAGSNVIPICQQFVDEILTVEEHYIALAVLRLVELEKSVVEGAGATGLAPLLSGQLTERYKGKNVCIVLCGGNIDVTLLGRVIDHGLAADGRLVRYHGRISDQPGGLAKFCAVIGNSGATIRQIFHDRTFTGDDFSLVRVEVTVCTIGRQQGEELCEKLNEAGFATKLVNFAFSNGNDQYGNDEREKNLIV